MQNVLQQLLTYSRRFHPLDREYLGHSWPTDAHWAGVASHRHTELWKAYTTISAVNDFFKIRLTFERESVESFWRGHTSSGGICSILPWAEHTGGRLRAELGSIVDAAHSIAGNLGAHVKKSEKSLLLRARARPATEEFDRMLFNGLLACAMFPHCDINATALLRKAYILKLLMALPDDELTRRVLIQL